MKICHVITRFIRGGADENTLFSCNGQVAAGHEVHLIYGNEADEEFLAQLDPRVRRHELPALQRTISVGSELRALVGMTRLLTRLKPDIVHTHTSKAGIIGRMAAIATGVPVIIHGVHILPFVNVVRIQGFVYRQLERLVAPFTDAFVSVGEDMRKGCIEAGIGAPTKHHVIPSGMDLTRFCHRKEDNWQSVLPGLKLAISKPRFLLLVSRLERRKRQYDFLDVFVRLADHFPDIVLLLAGEGPDRQRIEERVAKLGLSRRVVFTGYREDIERLMAISEIGLLTSIREGLPRVLVQYALMGLPIVATDIPGVREIVTPSVTGYVTPPDDLMEMEAPLVLLLRDEQVRTEIAANAKDLDLRRWSIEYMNRELAGLYQQLAQHVSPK